MDLTRRSIIAAGLAIPAAALAAKARVPAARSYRDMLVIDGLGEISDPYAPPEQARFSARAEAEMRASGVTAANMTVSAVGNAPGGWEATLENIASYDKAIADNQHILISVRRAADFLAAKAQGKVGLYYGTQDTSFIGTQLDRLGELKAKGVRQVQLTYNLRNLSGDGALEPANAGLSKLGRATIARIEAERMMLDLSHGGALTMAQATAAATRPLLISHTGCRALHDNPRNTADSTMRAVADKGGCVGIYFMSFLSPTSKPTGEELLAHIEHAAKVCGENHVSIGTDGAILPTVIDAKAREDRRKDWENRSAAGIAAPGEGPDVFTLVLDYNSLDKFERLAAALQKRGWSSAQVEKLLGANLLRVYGEVWG